MPTLTDSVALTGPLDTAALRRAATPLTVTVDAAVRARVERGRRLFRTLREDGPVYGATTGFGALLGYAGRADEADQCDNTLAHLGAGQGPDLPEEITRAALLLRTWSLAQGHSGVSAEVVDRLAAMFATTFAPAVPRYGSVGASGDLIPLAYATQALRGRGHAYLDGRRLPAADALTAAGLTPLTLDGRDALALVNGTSVTTAALALARDTVRAAHRALTTLTCLLTDLLGCDPGFLDAELLRAYGHPGAAAVGTRMRHTLAGVTPSGTRPLQEPYSIRCAPQLLGAAEDALAYVDGVVAADLGGISDNPLFFAGDAGDAGDTVTGKAVHGGNFFGQPAAFAADLLASVTAQLGNLAERQLDLLVDPARNGGLPPMLTTTPGVQHGLQGVQLATTAFVAEIRRNTTPASAQSLPTNLHNQDVVPFGTQAALRSYDMAGLLGLLAGSLALGLRQAAHAGARRPTAPRCAALLDALAARIPPVEPDRPLDADVRAAARLLLTYELP
ncbi:aromatic amino acid ammonia-lyase [Streptomyces griseoviridis]|uniref:Histidine ammonia-lyase/tyrosine ammonia-lyase n=1 Tax=Streptomyces griseoviridis TaxID=45398 RepID=A0ABT9L789_STRGD|nr:aromatic amino acid ammonia-lyase [Streptomyces griseoviridis]MDP9679573.1 histidine ammonia-lyase/tyrosine ammonia-lyase [Streptomyces griseoviridis]GGT00143.1 histidine ammonia-lyase [Streptomyces griseoviridis]